MNNTFVTLSIMMLLHLGGVRVTWVRSFTTTPSRTLLRPYVPWVLSSTSSSSTLFSTASKTSASSDTPSSKIPVTLLAGFLGAGKTSTLQNLLLNNVGAKIGVIVNDVPSINIDAKMIANTAVLDKQGLLSSSTSSPLVLNGDDTIELNNGCACCSLADELLTAVYKLTKGGTRSFDAIVVELTGVADPMAVKSNWEQAVEMMHPATQVSQVNRVVTLVDACTFGSDWMTWDTSGDRKNWVSEGDECSAARHVPELLAEQVEAANLILINKVDLAEPGQVDVATTVARALNDKAEWKQVVRGDIDPWTILGLEDPAKMKKMKEEAKMTSCSDPVCNDPTHEHSHNHDVEVETSSSSCSDPVCNDPTHNHEHSHDHHNEASASCSDPVCNDPTHNHEHSHDHATSTKSLGITSFVFKADRPFNANRLLGILNQWPVPIKDELDLALLSEAAVDGYEMKNNQIEKSPFVGVLRSKGFCWLAPTRWSSSKGDAWRHDTAMYWSHAGKHFGITTAGKWWGTLDSERLKQYFSNNPKEYDRIMREDWLSPEFGDRRQELVFIGVQLDEKDIRETLNNCLCTEEEMTTYRRQLRNFLDTTFTVSSSSGPSLFDVGGVGHVE